MITYKTAPIRLLIFLLVGALIIATLLVVQINPIEIILTYLALLVGATMVGLFTNLWGGLLASMVATFALVMINQYVGIYPRENYLVNISSELIAFLVVGPLAGCTAMLLERLRRRTDHWQRLAEEHTVYDEVFGTLKPEWAKVRLEEEVLRAVGFKRPLAVALLELETASPSHAERVAGIQALIRVSRSSVSASCLVAHAGRGQVLLVLPEHNPDQAKTLLSEIQERAKTELFFPPETGKPTAQVIGKPLGEWGRLRTGLANLDGQPADQDLFNQAHQALEA
jgi:GGDEF domain-containing protein